MTPGFPTHPESYYAATAVPHPVRPVLDGVLVADVCVVGAGFTGLSAALHLAEAGYSVVVLEGARVGWGASGRNGGQAWSGQARNVLDLERRLGRELARALWDMAEEARLTLVERIGRHAIRCDYRQGTLLAAIHRGEVRGFESEAEHLARHYYCERMRVITEGDMRDLVGSRHYLGGLYDPDGGHLHPLNLALGLAGAAAEAGAAIYEGSRVEHIDWNLRSAVRTAAGRVEARYVLLCTNAYGDELIPEQRRFAAPITTSQIATAPLGEARARSLISNGCCVCSTSAAVDYFRLTPDHRLLFGSGAWLAGSDPARAGAAVRARLLRIFPQLADAPIAHTWSGQLAITHNRLPHFGRVKPNGFFARGFSGQGVVLTQFAGRLLAEAVAGTAERFDVLADLPRRRFVGGWCTAHPLAAAGLLYRALRERL